jgi:hypothetical protein
MNPINPGKVILSIAILLVVFLMGGGLGIMYQAQKTPASPAVPQQVTPPIVKQLSSKIFATITAYGQITDINGTNITLTYAGDTTTIKVKDNVIVYSFVTDSKGVPSQKTIDFNQLKKGDSVNVNCVLLSDGSLEGHSVLIMPSASVTPLPAK